MNKFPSYFFPPTIAAAILVVVVLQIILPEKDMKLSAFVLLLAIFPMSIIISGILLMKSNTRLSSNLLRNIDVKTLGKVAVGFGTFITICTIIAFILTSIFLSDVAIWELWTVSSHDYNLLFTIEVYQSWLTFKPACWKKPSKMSGRLRNRAKPRSKALRISSFECKIAFFIRRLTFPWQYSSGLSSGA